MNPKPFWESKTFWGVMAFLLVAVLQTRGYVDADSLMDLAEKVASALIVLGIRGAQGGGLSRTKGGTS